MPWTHLREYIPIPWHKHIACYNVHHPRTITVNWTRQRIDATISDFSKRSPRISDMTPSVVRLAIRFTQARQVLPFNTIKLDAMATFCQSRFGCKLCPSWKVFADVSIDSKPRKVSIWEGIPEQGTRCCWLRQTRRRKIGMLYKTSWRCATWNLFFSWPIVRTSTTWT